jgi:hypothetical protein
MWHLSYAPDAHEWVIAICFLNEERLLTEHDQPARTLVRSATTGELLSESKQRYSDHLREAFYDDAEFITTIKHGYNTRMLAVSLDWKREVLLDRSRTVVEVHSACGKPEGRARLRRRVGWNEGGPWEQLDERRIVQQSSAKNELFRVFTDKEPRWRVWDWTTTESLGSLPLRPWAIDRTGRFAVVLAETNTPEIVHLASGQVIDMPGLPVKPLWVAVAPNGSQIAAGEMDGKISITSPDSDGSVEITSNLTLDPPATVGAFAPDGQRLLAAHSCGVSLLDLATGLAVYNEPIPMRVGDPLIGISYGLDGRRAVCWSGTQLLLIDSEMGRSLSVFEIRKAPPVLEGKKAISYMPFFFLPNGLLLVRAPERFQAINPEDGKEVAGISVPARWRVLNWQHLDTAIRDSENDVRIAWFPKPFRSAEVMGDGRTIVLAHAGTMRLEILQIEGGLESKSV